MNIAGGGIAQIHVLDRCRRDALSLSGYQNKRQRFTAGRIRRGVDEAVNIVSPVGACAPALGPVDDQHVAVDAATRLHAGEIAADIRFGEAVGEEQLTARQFWQKLGLLCGRTVLRDVHAAIEGAVDERPGEERACSRQLFDDCHGGNNVLTEAAMFFRDGEAANTQIAKLAEQITRPVVSFVPCAPFLARRFFCDEAA